MDELTFPNRQTDREESESTHNMKNQLHFSSGNVREFDSSAWLWGPGRINRKWQRLDQQEMAGSSDTIMQVAMLCNAQLLYHSPESFSARTLLHMREPFGACKPQLDTEQQLHNHNNTYPWESTVSPSVTFHRLTSNDI